MSQKKTTNTTQTNTYDPASMNAFKGFTNQVSGYTNQWLGINGNASPTATPGFNLNYQSNLNNANAINARNMRNVTSNALALGSNPNSAATQAILARAGRGASGLQSNAFMNAYQNSLNQQNVAASMAGSYRPLQTGGTQSTTEQTGGLGSWLPQVAGMAIGAAMPFMNPLSAAKGPTATNAGAGGGYNMPSPGYMGIGSSTGPTYFGSYR